MDSAVKNSERLDFERQERDWGLDESARMSVRQKKSWFRTAELANPDKTVYSTTSESMLVIESDGTATCVGTQGRGVMIRRSASTSSPRVKSVASPRTASSSNVAYAFGIAIRSSEAPRSYMKVPAFRSRKRSMRW